MNLETLDEGIREEIRAHALDRGPRVIGVGVIGVELEIDDPTDASGRDLKAELAKRALDGVALRVEDALLRPNEHRRSHRTTSGRAR